MSPEFKPLWIETNNTEGYKKTPHFIRRSDVVRFSNDNSFQAAVISPTGFVPSNEILHFGYASGNTPIKFLFPDFGSPLHTQLTFSIEQANLPKTTKRVSGDMMASVIMFERDGSARNFSILNILVDNLTTKSNDKYGLLKTPADGYATESGREALIADPQKYIDYFYNTALLKPESGSYGINGDIQNIPSHALKLRNATLGLFSDLLPESSKYSEIFKGVYGITLSRFRVDPVSGSSGECISVRSKADVSIKVNNKIDLNSDNHRPAQAVAMALGAQTNEIYQAKLRTHIYDTTGFAFRDNIGEFEIYVCDCSISRGEVSNSISIASDGYELGNEVDDASRLNMYFYANS